MNGIFYTATATAEEIPNWFAVTMGIGTVFVGLISIIIICLITGALFGNKKAKPAPPAAPGGVSGEDPRERQKILAAVCAACAEDMGTDVSRIRVVSFKKIN